MPGRIIHLETYNYLSDDDKTKNGQQARLCHSSNGASLALG